MFGFLKDKLKKAVKKFSKSAKEEVKEEKVDDKKTIEKAKKEEKKIVKKAPKKPAPKKVPAEKEAPKKKPAPKKIPAKPKKPIPKAPEKPIEEKPVPKKKAPAAKKEPPKKEKAEERPTPDKAPEDKPKGFFKKLFTKKVTHEKVEKEIKEVEEEGEKELEEVERIEEKQRKAEERLEEKQKLEKELEEAEDLKQAEKEIAEEEYEEETPEEFEAEEEEEEEEQLEEDIEQLAEIEVELAEEKVKEKSVGFMGKLKDAFTKKTLSQEKFDELFWELEVTMLENNVAVEVIEKIKEDLKHELTSGKVNRMGLEDMVMTRLRKSIDELFDVETFDMVKRIKKADKPFKICVIGVNGSGKTTTLAKLIHLFKKNKLTCVVAASDTFRAAAIDQLKEHTDKLGVKLISQGYHSDPAAVAYDAIEHAKAQNIDVVLVDTAGRLHSNTNLMQELEKVVRVTDPDLKLFVGESITGNDCVEQAKVFNDLVGIDALILSKADVDEKGGAAISVSYVTGKPILYLGTGQTYEDLIPFDKDKIIEAIGL